MKATHTADMKEKQINEVLASNLAHFMGKRQLSQKALASRSGVAQTTISLYLDPTRRKPGATGKVPSAKLSEVEMLASALSVEVWELLRNLTAEEREVYDQLESVVGMLKAKRKDAKLPEQPEDAKPTKHRQPANTEKPAKAA